MMKLAFAACFVVAGVVAACVGGGGPLPSDQGASSSGEKPNPSSEEQPSGVEKETPPSTTTPREAGTQICTPGSFAFCRCADRSEGAARCKADGTGREACACTPDAG